MPMANLFDVRALEEELTQVERQLADLQGRVKLLKKIQETCLYRLRAAVRGEVTVETELPFEEQTR